MALSFSKPRYSPIAVDFGADRLKLLQVIANDPPQIVAAAAAEMPEHTKRDPTARHAFYLESLKTLLKSAPFKGKRVVCSIPAYQTLVQHLQIAKSDHEDFDSQVGVLLRQRLNLDVSRMVIRTFQVGQVVRDGSSKQEVICMAASKESVMRHIETAHRAKLDVVGMHCEPHAIVKAFAHMYRREGDDERTTCFLDMGGATTKMIIAHGAEVAFAKMVHVAGDHLNRARAEANGIDVTEARRLRIDEAANVKAPAARRADDVERERKRNKKSGVERRGEGGLPAGLAEIEAALAQEFGDTEKQHTGGIAVDEMIAPAPVAVAIDSEPAEDPLECLIDEIQMCMRYHQSIFSDRPIEKIVFMGGEAHHVAACQRIARTLRIGAQLGDPVARLTGANSKNSVGIDLTRPQPGWAVPLGLCLSETNL